MEATVYNLQGQETQKINLPDIFESKISVALLHDVVTAYLANQRAGTASTKTRGEVSGSGRKPWKQKGTGNARAGSLRSPLWRKGGIVFGPHPKDFYQRIPGKKKVLALKMAVCDKVRGGDTMILEDLILADNKTKKLIDIFKALKVNERKVLLVVDNMDDNLKRASRNIPWLSVVSASDINAYQVMNSKKLIIKKGAIDQLVKRYGI
jgi:large subunit ribosomal protein L4